MNKNTSLSLNELKDFLSTDKSIEQIFNNNKQTFQSGDLINLFISNIALSFLVSLAASASWDAIKKKISENPSLSKKDLKAVEVLLNQGLIEIDLKNIDKGMEVTREILFSYNINDPEGNIEGTLMDYLKVVDSDDKIKEGGE